MSGSLLEANTYCNFVRKVEDTQTWKPIMDTLDSRLNTIVQRTEETQTRIETTTLSDLLSRIYCRENSESFSYSSTGSLSGDSSIESLDADRDTDGNSTTDGCTGKDTDASSTSTDVESTITQFTENDIVPSPTEPDNRYQQEKPLRSWKKIHSVFLNRRRRRFCDMGPISETSSTSSVEWCTLEESMENQGLLRGPFEIDFIKPQYENAYISSTHYNNETDEPISKARAKIDLSRLIAEYDRQNTSFLIRIPTDLSPKIPKAKVKYIRKHRRSKSSSGPYTFPDEEKNNNTSSTSYRENTEVRPPNKASCRPNMNLEDFVEAEPFVPIQVQHQQQQEPTDIIMKVDNVGLMTDGKWRKNDEQQEIEENFAPPPPKTTLTATAKEFIPKNATTAAFAAKVHQMTSHIPGKEIPEVVPSTPPYDTKDTKTRQKPRLSEIFENSPPMQANLTEPTIHTNDDNYRVNADPVLTHTEKGVDYSKPATYVDNVSNFTKRCGTLGQTVTDHTQPLPRIGRQPPSGVPHHNGNVQQDNPVLQSACNRRQINNLLHPEFPQIDHMRYEKYNGNVGSQRILGDPVTGLTPQHRHQLHNQYAAQMYATNPQMFHHMAQAHVQTGHPHYALYMVQAHHQQQQHLANQQARNVNGIQDPSVLYCQQNQQLMCQRMSSGFPQAQAHRNIEQMTAHGQFQYQQEQRERNMATSQALQLPSHAVPRHRLSMMERFNSPSKVTEFVPRTK